MYICTHMQKNRFFEIHITYEGPIISFKKKQYCNKITCINKYKFVGNNISYNQNPCFAASAQHKKHIFCFINSTPTLSRKQSSANSDDCKHTFSYPHMWKMQLCPLQLHIALIKRNRLLATPKCCDMKSMHDK